MWCHYIHKHIPISFNVITTWNQGFIYYVEQIKHVDVEWVPSCSGNGAQRFCLWEKKYLS